jgi:hypothetical protein
MQYDVLIDFTDPEDARTVYRAGKDKYPRKGYTPSKERIRYLQSKANKFKAPVIAKTATEE